MDVKSNHAPGFEVTLTGSDTTGESGKTVLSLQIKATNAKENPKGVIRINGGNPIMMENRVKTIPLNVTVPEGSTKSFSYSVEIKEEGCPSFSTKVSKSVSNPPRKRKEIKPDEKKKIIIQ